MSSFLKRLFSSVLLLSLFYCAIFLKNDSVRFYFFSFLVTALSYCTVFEFCSILKRSGHQVMDRILPLAVTLCSILMLFQRLELVFLIAMIVILLLWGSFLLSKNTPEGLEKTLFSTAVFALFTVPFVLLVQLYFKGGPMVFLFLILVTKIGDIGAYLTGTICNKILPGGNHKMIPSISPGKSYEGAAGGLLFSIALSFTLSHYVVHYHWIMALVLGVLLYFGGAAGDLAESSFKRICGVKDSGRMLPGIGGAFDLVDSLLMNVILFTLVLLLFPR